MLNLSLSADCAEDLRLLLDCLRYHYGNIRHGSPQRQALTTIAAMCSNDSEREREREGGREGECEREREREREREGERDPVYVCVYVGGARDEVRRCGLLVYILEITSSLAPPTYRGCSSRLSLHPHPPTPPPPSRLRHCCPLTASSLVTQQVVCAVRSTCTNHVTHSRGAGGRNHYILT